MDELFDFVVDSSSVGVRKPDPRIFEIALGHLDGVAREAVVFLDDYQANVDAARGLGLRAITVSTDLDAVIAELDAMLARLTSLPAPRPMLTVNTDYSSFPP